MLSLKSALLFIFFVCDMCSSESDYLITSGWYKTQRKSNKVTITDAHSLGPNTLSNVSTYMKIGGSVPVLRRGAVHDLVDLMDLKINSAVIEEVHPGAFENLPKLSKLNLKNNAIQHIPTGVFNKLNISILFLNNNEISNIESNAFDDMRNLIKIKLNSNKLSAWNSEWFKRTPNLAIVLMRRNDIEELHENAFVNFAANKVNAINIYLSKNRIREIHPGAFSGIEKWGEVFFDRNKLRQLNGNIFGNVDNIRKLDFSRNNITQISGDLLKTVRSVEILDLAANHRLECVPVTVAKQVQKVQLKHVRKLTCACVSDLSNVTHVTSTLKC